MVAETWTVRVRDRLGNVSAPATVQLDFAEPPSTVFGVAAPGNEQPAHRAVYGNMGFPRFFFAPAKRFGWGLFPLNARQPGDTPVVSWKTWNEQDFVAMLDQATVDWWACYFHEPEDDIATGTLTPADHQAVVERMKALRDAHPNGTRCRIITILNWYQATQRGFNWRRLTGSIAASDAVGMDCYSLAADATKNIYTPPADLFGPIVDISTVTGKPWAAPEFAVKMAADNDTARHAAQLQAYINHAKAHNAMWVSYWCNVFGGHQYHLCTNPIYDQALPVWREAMRP